MIYDVYMHDSYIVYDGLLLVSDVNDGLYI